MRRRPWFLLVAVAIITVATLVVRTPSGPDADGRAATAGRDGATPPAAVAAADSAPDDDAPCLAARLGLPCR